MAYLSAAGKIVGDLLSLLYFERFQSCLVQKDEIRGQGGTKRLTDSRKHDLQLPFHANQSSLPTYLLS